MARKKTSKKNPARKAKAKRNRQTGSEQSSLVCEARDGQVGAKLLKSAASGEQRHNVLPRIVKRIVDSCELLPEINHLDMTVLPESDVVVRIVEVTCEIFYPGYFGEKTYGLNNVAYHIGDRLHALYLMLAEQIFRSVRRAGVQPLPHSGRGQCPGGAAADSGYSKAPGARRAGCHRR